MKIDRFDLEQKIMEAWHTVDDIRMLARTSEKMTSQQLASALAGLEIFADTRFHELWDTFEKCISNQVFEVEDDSDSDTISLIDLDTGDTMYVDTEFVLHENP